jgi:pimeloyl-ACP methyl ester carboxylesterase
VPTLDVNGQIIHYVESGGDGAPVVLVHGSGGSHEVWSRQLAGLADAAHVVALDLPGHGRSSGAGCRRIDDYAAIVRDFVASLGRGPVVLGGHSMGGAVAQRVALTAPDVLRGLVLVGTGARLRVLPKILELMETDYAEGVTFLTEYAWSPSSPEPLKEAGRRALSATRASVTSGDFAACDVFDVMSAIGQIRLPTLVIVGEDDRLTPPKYAEYFARHIPGARLVRAARAGHYVQLEQPAQVNDAIRSFLAMI